MAHSPDDSKAIARININESGAAQGRGDYCQSLRP